MEFEHKDRDLFILNTGEHSKEPKTLKDMNRSEAQVIKEQIGDIEEIRMKLGLNKRKICELLLIDPSTWTRWSTGKTDVPPHIYRMLQWGLALMEGYPELHPMSQFSNINSMKRTKELTNRVVELEESLNKIARDAEGVKKLGFRGYFFFLAPVIFILLLFLLTSVY